MPLPAENVRMAGVDLAVPSAVQITITLPEALLGSDARAQSSSGRTTQIFHLYRLHRRLFRLDETGCKVEVALDPKAFSVLDELAKRPGELVTKEEIKKELWPGRLVEDGAVHAQMAGVRRALGQRRKNPDQKNMQPSCIKSSPGQGW